MKYFLFLFEISTTRSFTGHTRCQNKQHNWLVCLPQALQLFRQFTFMKAGVFWHSPFLAQPGHWALYLLLSSQLEAATVRKKFIVLRYFEKQSHTVYDTIKESLLNNICLITVSPLFSDLATDISALSIERAWHN